MRTPETVNCSERTLVLVGKTGNGKSATGNSIIGYEVFDSKTSSAGVTSSCQLETTKLDDGQILNVIDTPGLYDPSVEPLLIAREIAKCIALAKDGIHAVLLVLSIRSRFSQDDALAFKGLREIFGPKIVDRMIVVFTNGDALGRNGHLDDFVRESELLKSTVEMCGGRRVLFDNWTDNEVKVFGQRKKLLSLVKEVVDNNGGMPYTNDLFDELKMGEVTSSEISDQWLRYKKYEDRFERFIEMVELRLRESILRLEKQVAEEKAARLEAEAKAKTAHDKSEAAMLDLEKRLKSAEDLNKDLNVKLQNSENKRKEAEASKDKSEAAMLDLEKRLKSAEDLNKDLNVKLHNRENKRKEAEASKDKSEAAMFDLEKRLKRAEDLNKDLNVKLQNRENKRKEAEASKDKSEAAMLHLEKRLKSAEDLNKDLNVKLQNRENKRKEAEASKDKSEAAMLHLEKRLKSAEDLNKDLNVKLQNSENKRKGPKASKQEWARHSRIH